MARQQARHHPNPDFRHRVPVPMPAVEEVEQQLWALLSPSLLAPRLVERRDPHTPQRVIRLRARLLTLPVRVASIVSLVWRRLGAVAEVQRVLAREGLLWVQPLQVSEQALAKRLTTLPGRSWGSFLPRSVRGCRPSPCRLGPGWRAGRSCARTSR